MKTPFILLMLFTCSACTMTTADEFSQPYTWHATGVNDANLKVMVANPEDLISGESAGGTALGSESNPAVKRLLTGQRYPLAATSSTGMYTPMNTTSGGSSGTAN